jgi:Lon protease-like protein
VRDCLDGDREFGVVLIARGSEVGGEDQRTDLGTMAHLAEAVELPDGRWAVAAVGVRRIRVREWLPDDPYPVADVEDWPDPVPGSGYDEQLRHVLAQLRRALALAAEAGDPAAPATIELSSDPVLAGYQAAAVAPLGPLDQQRLLAAVTPEARLADLSHLLADATHVLELRLGGPEEGY